MFIIAGVLGISISFVHRHQRSLYKNEGDYNVPNKDQDVVSGKLSVLSEHSEEEYQRTIQSVQAQKELLRELDKIRENKVSVVNEEVSGVDNDA
jgi:hypothetical protein